MFRHWIEVVYIMYKCTVEFLCMMYIEVHFFADIHAVYNESLQFPENTRTDFPPWRVVKFYTFIIVHQEVGITTVAEQRVERVQCINS